MKLEISGSDLAKDLGVTRQAVSRWEIGISRPNGETAAKLADYFGVTVDELLADGKEAPK